MSNTLYERDFYAWANEQAALLRAGKLDHADIENIAEEIESMGRSEKRELVSKWTGISGRSDPQPMLARNPSTAALNAAGWCKFDACPASGMMIFRAPGIFPAM